MKIAVLTGTLVLAGIVGMVSAQQRPSSTRTILQTEPSSVAEREVVTAMHTYSGTVMETAHVHPGDLAGYVVEGSLTLSQDGAADRTLKIGDTFFVRAGVHHHVVSRGNSARILATYVVEKGKPLAE